MRAGEITGTVLDIERCAMHDGPGIRTSVFLKGCPLSCQWCHNPESQSFAPQLAFWPAKCINCGACARICPHGAQRMNDGSHEFERELCTACGLCADYCPTNALKCYGKRLTVEQVMQIVCKDIAYYAASGGGLTITGGEPLAQPDFSLALLRAAKANNIHTCAETCGYVAPAILEESAALVDCFLFDYKLTSPRLHKAFTGADNRLILENLERLYTLGKNIVLRCPIIPGVNDTDEHFAGIARLEARYPGLAGVEILPYHDMGREKAKTIGASDLVQRATAGDADKRRWKEQMAACGCSYAAIASF